MYSFWRLLLCLSVFLFTTNLHAQSYENVPTESERKSDSRFKRLPGWDTIEFVRDNVINNQLTALLDRSKWRPDIQVSKLKWLQLQNLDIFVPGISSKDGIVSIPFFVDVRFEEKNNPLAQGTLNSEGLILVSVQEGEIRELTVVKYHTSSAAEDWGRTFRIIDKYDGNFATGVIQSPLIAYLSTNHEFFKIVREAASQRDPLPLR